MSIHDEIKQAIIDFRMRTNNNAKSIYLGRSQMKGLMRWAKEMGYLASEDAPREGDHRPEVMGCLVFEVNSENHCAAA